MAFRTGQLPLGDTSRPAFYVDTALFDSTIHGGENCLFEEFLCGFSRAVTKSLLGAGLNLSDDGRQLRFSHLVRRKFGEVP
jgi:hypothetical protein